MSNSHDWEAPLTEALPTEALTAVNLNALVALDALFAERSVTRAAARMGVTQSAMSHTLGQLRAQLGDRLLVRGARGLELTSRAQALVAPLRRGLRTLARAVTEPEAFAPARSHRRFRIAAGDYGAALLLPPLLARLGREAPSVDLDVVPTDVHRAAVALERDDVDAVIGVAIPADAGLKQRTLWEDGFVTVMRRGHPAAAKLDAARFAALSHVLISPRAEGLGQVDDALAERGLARRIAVRVPYFLAAPPLVAASDLVLTAPRRLAARFVRTHPLRIVEPPLRLPRFRVVVAWHVRHDADPAHRWLRAQLVAAAAADA